MVPCGGEIVQGRAKSKPAIVIEFPGSLYTWQSDDAGFFSEFLRCLKDVAFTEQRRLGDEAHVKLCDRGGHTERVSEVCGGTTSQATAHRDVCQKTGKVPHAWAVSLAEPGR